MRRGVDLINGKNEGPAVGFDHRVVFNASESEVRSYCRTNSELFVSATGATVTDDRGREFIDFMSACGALNYGHNHPALKDRAIAYLAGDGIATAMDYHTAAKLGFITAFESKILRPRGLDHRMQFTGPTGANCVEAALKLARKKTGRFNIAAFTNAFHGVTAGALAATGSAHSRTVLSGRLNGVVRLPYDGYRGACERDLDLFAEIMGDPSGGIDPVAGVIVECVQGEGGLNVARNAWLRRLEEICRSIGALLIVDDIQTGCGRTGDFFGFERAGIVPDLVCLAKSISGFGLPMSLLLIRPQHDVWSPGEHNGTFRGNSLAFVTAAAAIDLWTPSFRARITERETIVRNWCMDISARFPDELTPKGLGLMRGLAFAHPELAARSAVRVREMGLLIELCGPYDEVLKIMPPINIDVDLLVEGLARLRRALERTLLEEDACRTDPIASPPLQGDQPTAQSDHHGGDAVWRSEFLHGIA